LQASRQTLTALINSLSNRHDMQNAIARLMRPEDMLETFSELADIQGRASFYVASTRAIEYLEVFASSRSGLVPEMEQAVAALK